MFLLRTSIFPWDLAILLLLALSAAIFFTTYHWLKVAKRKSAARLGIRVIQALAAVSFFLVFYGSFIEPQIITVTRSSISFPTGHSLKIAVLSDLHLGPYKGERFLRRVVAKTNALLPDVVILTGDYILSNDWSADDLSALRPLRDLRSTYGTFAALGNHDHGIYRGFDLFGGTQNDPHETLTQALLQFNVTVLRNSNRIIDAKPSHIAIAGIDDVYSRTADLPSTLAGIPPDTPTVLIAHNPDVILARLQAIPTLHLVIAGHTHGGQIRLPFLGAVAHLPIVISQRYDQGLFPIGDGLTLAISRGIGESGPRARLFAWPEILLLATEKSFETTMLQPGN